MSDTTVPVWLDGSVITVRILSRSEVAEIISGPYDLDPEEVIQIVQETTELPDETVEKMEIQTVAKIAKHALPDPRMSYE